MLHIYTGRTVGVEQTSAAEFHASAAPDEGTWTTRVPQQLRVLLRPL